ncbi:hypothetical protein GCM10009836_47890 [Pseudonocardia ailaonensis]|uniref:GH16 domain-containing protein n=1 Tax=Pseudonocardia ailaonensis TaxID=367279 RepID=A0ABN2NEX4_9PSEU
MRKTVLSRTLAVAVSGCALVALTATPAFAATGSAPGTQTAPVQAGAGQPARAGAAQAGGGQAVAGKAVAGQTESHCDTTAGDSLKWGPPTRESDFDGTTLPPDWHAYGPEPGHMEDGTRSPDAVTVEDGAVTISGDEEGNTGAISWHPGQKYGRWEGCVKADPGAGGYNALFLLWPVKEDWPVGGEVDWMEIMSDDRQETSFFLHYGANNDQEYGSVKQDSTEWTAYALEWTPEKITGFVNGKEWFSSTDTSHFPPGAMNMTMQLDYFRPAGGPTAMHMDWAKQWALPESEPAQLSLGPGEPATGQSQLHPDRAPRPLDQIQDPAPTPATATDPVAPADPTAPAADPAAPATGSDQGATAGSDPAPDPAVTPPTGSVPATGPSASTPSASTPAASGAGTAGSTT